ncbi:hypothetical protein ES705_31493 [subsurface metagenome]
MSCAGAVEPERYIGKAPPPPPPINECNDCDPRIPDTISVTFNGLPGDFAWANRQHDLVWYNRCFWFNYYGPTEWEYIRLNWLVNKWALRVNSTSRASCFVQWTTSLDPCDPRGPGVDCYVYPGSCVDELSRKACQWGSAYVAY